MIRTVAVDVPSGVDVDTGELDGPHVRADVTVTFGTHKGCHLLDPAAEAAGVVVLVDIGLELPDPLVTALQAAKPVLKPAAEKSVATFVAAATSAPCEGLCLLP